MFDVSGTYNGWWYFRNGHKQGYCLLKGYKKKGEMRLCCGERCLQIGKGPGYLYCDSFFSNYYYPGLSKQFRYKGIIGKVMNSTTSQAQSCDSSCFLNFYRNLNNASLLLQLIVSSHSHDANSTSQTVDSTGMVYGVEHGYDKNITIEMLLSFETTFMVQHRISYRNKYILPNIQNGNL